MVDLKLIEENINILSRLLNDKKDEDNRNIIQLYNELFVILEKELYSVLSDVTQYQNRMEVYNHIRSIIEEMEIYLTYPQLLGKSFIGIIAFHTWEEPLSEILGTNITNILRQNSSIPCIVIHGKEICILANNTVEHTTILNEDEYSRVCKNFNKKIDYSKILKNFMVTLDGQLYSNLNFCWLPRFMERASNEFNNNLLERLDAIIVYGVPENDKEHKRWDFYTKFCEQRNIPIYIVNNNQISFRQDTYRCQIINITQNELYHQLDIPRENYLFVDKLNSIFLSMKKFFQEKLIETTDDIRQITTDLVKILSGKTYNYLKEMQNELSENKTLLEEKWFAIQKANGLLQQKAVDFEKKLKDLSNIGEQNICQPSMFVVWKKLFLQSLELNDLSLANDCIQILKKYNHDEVYICEILLNDVRGNAPSNNELDRIKWAVDTDFIRHAKMRLIKYLGFSNRDYMFIARDLHSLHTPIEFYYRALWEEENKNWIVANNLYKKALIEGYEKATDGFLRTAKRVSQRLDELDSILVPAANYELGREFINEKRFAKGTTLIKIAATNKYLPAIKYLANDFYRKVSSNFYKKLSEEEQTTKIDTCISIFKYIISQEPNNKELQEKMGYLYKQKGDERRALEIWQKCETKKALYECGRLYQYTDGNIPQDLDKAIDFFTKASNLGHEKANEELKKVIEWKKQQQERTANQYNKSQSYRPRIEIRDERHDSGCFITTATCQALNKGDNCEELMVMRHFRDTMKEKIPGIDVLVKEYYRIAPLIVKKIDKNALSNEEYYSLWNNDLFKCYKMIQTGAYKEAIIQYISMVKRLSYDYKEPFTPGIEENIAKIVKYLNKSNIM